MLTADHFVVAAGSESQRVLKWAQVALPVRPIKGYSITFENQRGTLPLRVPIIDDALHVGIVPLKASWRIVGGAELAGRSGSLDPAHIDSLLKLARRVLPNTGNDRSAGHAWCGLRPVSADGVPIIGATRWPNLWINTGHGHLGWTLAAASSELLADLMMGTPPSTDPAPFALARFEDRA